MTQSEDLINSLQSIYRTIVRANGGNLETGQELEYSSLIYNVGVMAMDQRQFFVAEKFLWKLYTASQPSGSSSNKDKDKIESPMIKEELLPMLITLNLLNKNHVKAMQLMSECKEDSRYDFT